MGRDLKRLRPIVFKQYCLSNNSAPPSLTIIKHLRPGCCQAAIRL